MRIVIIINGLGIGGGERHVAHLVGGLRQRGHAVTVFCLTRGGVIAEELQRDGVPTVQLTRSGRPLPGGWRRLVAELRAADVLHTHFFYSDLLARTGLRPWRPPRLVSTRHETGFWMHRAHRRVEPWLYRGFDRVVCVSEAVKSSLSERGVDTRRLVHVRPGIPMPDTGASEHDGGAPPTVLFVGRLERVKGADVLVSAFALSGLDQAGWRLMLCGDGPERGTLQRQVRAAGLGDRCLFLGGQPRERVRALMREASIFVLPSRSEAISLSLLEAMSHQAAVIASNVEGVREVVTHASSGWLVPSEDAGELARALTQLAEHPELRRELGQAARARVLTDYGLSRFVDEMIAVYAGD